PILAWSLLLARLLWPIPHAAAQEGSPQRQPDLTSDTRGRLSEAAENPTIAPWQREFMMAMARNGSVGVAGGGGAAANLAAALAHFTSSDGSWEQIPPPPSARYGQTAVYDPVRYRMVVFGGANGNQFFNDVWALSLAGSPVWTQLTPPGPLPSGRRRHTAIY